MTSARQPLDEAPANSPAPEGVGSGVPGSRPASASGVEPGGSAGRPADRAGGGETFRETLRPAFWWWLVAMGLWLSVTVAVWAYLAWPWAVAATLAVGLLSGTFIWQQGLVVVADAAGLRAGRNRIEWRWVADVVPLEAAAAEQHLSDPRHHDDFLAVRPYVRPAVLVRLADPADPHPAWVVSTRRPGALAAVARTYLLPR